MVYNFYQIFFKLCRQEKLEIVIGAAEPRFAGLAPRRLRRRNAFELIQEYSTNKN